MTTVCYKNGMIAADTAATISNTRAGHSRKIARNDKGDLAGAAGSAGFTYRFLQWFKNGEHGEQPVPQDEEHYIDRAMIIRADQSRQIELYEPEGMFCILDREFAVGGGRPLAMVAMSMGADARRAVQAAIDFDIYSAGPIDWLTHTGEGKCATWTASTTTKNRRKATPTKSLRSR